MEGGSGVSLRGKRGEFLPEPFAQLPYGREVELKQKGIERFWSMNGLGASPGAVVPSPLSRRYRTTTKRKVLRDRGKFVLSVNPRDPAVRDSLLEPERHEAIYSFIEPLLNEPALRGVAAHLNFVILRGSYDEHAVIFNVDVMNGDVVRRLRSAGERLAAGGLSVVSAFIFHDPTRSDYYFESGDFGDERGVKRLFGPRRIAIRIAEKSFAVAPLSFSQVNLSILPLMLDHAAGLLAPVREERLIDLYCGYGLFSRHLAPNYREIVGIDYEKSSIESAIEGAAALKKGRAVRYYARSVDPATIEKTLPDDGKSEAVLLDPPRQGAERGVIRSLAARNPLKVLHIFCNIDRIPVEAAAWEREGYVIRSAVHLDMFPGTPSLEAMVLFEPKADRPAPARGFSFPADGASALL